MQPSTQSTSISTKKQAEEDKFPGGYNYMHCTLYDNMTISDERKRKIEAQYDPNGIWYM